MKRIVGPDLRISSPSASTGSQGNVVPVKPPVAGLRRLMPFGEGKNRLREGRPYFVAQVFPVSLHRQDIIAALPHNL